ncbi:unnamed protein product [Dovyalis caffra]|uniref:Uncharacterized protein n=1 Tax=Dovyalis caffra TaxID=77055 RepID=A0AAV1R4Y4_9ROSI|nr:unnamed protein product [Dovyalis caffra]
MDKRKKISEKSETPTQIVEPPPNAQAVPKGATNEIHYYNDRATGQEKAEAWERINRAFKNMRQKVHLEKN